MCILQISFPVTCEILPCIFCNPSHSSAILSYVSNEVEKNAAWAVAHSSNVHRWLWGAEFCVARILESHIQVLVETRMYAYSVSILSGAHVSKAGTEETESRCGGQPRMHDTAWATVDRWSRVVTQAGSRLGGVNDSSPKRVQRCENKRLWAASCRLSCSLELTVAQITRDLSNLQFCEMLRSASNLHVSVVHVMNLRVPYKAKNMLNCWTDVSFSKRALLHWVN